MASRPPGAEGAASASAGSSGGREAGEPAPAPSRSLKSRAVTSSAWTLGGFGTGQAVATASNMALAFFLPREAFGLMGMVKIFTQGLKMFSDVGIGPAIIRSESGERREFLCTAWTIQAIRGFCLALGAAILAWPAAWFYATPQLQYLLPVAGLAAILAGFNSPALFLLNRKLNLRRTTLMDLSTQVVAATSMVALAWATGSVWALVAGWFVASGMSLALSHLATEPLRLRLTIDRASAGELLRFGRWIFASTAVTFFAAQVDKILLAKLLTLGEFGVYCMALTVTALPQTVCNRLGHAVLYPVLAEHVRRDVTKVPAVVNRARRVILPVSLVAVLGVCMGAPILFGYFYRPEYRDAGWIAPLLMLSVWFAILQASADRTLPALGDTRSLLVSNVVRLAATTVCCLVGQRLGGLPGFVIGVATGTFIGYLPVVVALARRGVHVLARDVRYTALLALLGGGPIGVAYWYLPMSPRPPLLEYSVLCMAGAIPAGLLAAERVRHELLGKRREARPVVTDDDSQQE